MKRVVAGPSQTVESAVCMECGDEFERLRGRAVGQPRLTCGPVCARARHLEQCLKKNQHKRRFTAGKIGARPGDSVEGTRLSFYDRDGIPAKEVQRLRPGQIVSKWAFICKGCGI